MDRDYADLGWTLVCAVHYWMHNRFVNCTGSSGQCHSCVHRNRAMPTDSVNVIDLLFNFSKVKQQPYKTANGHLHSAVRTFDYLMVLDLQQPNPFEISYVFDGVADICTILRCKKFENLYKNPKHSRSNGLELGKLCLRLDVQSCE